MLKSLREEDLKDLSLIIYIMISISLRIPKESLSREISKLYFTQVKHPVDKLQLVELAWLKRIVRKSRLMRVRMMENNVILLSNNNKILKQRKNKKYSNNNNNS